MKDNTRSAVILSSTLTLLAAFGFLVSSGTPCLARGGGGCIENGTEILTPGGMVPIERMRPGDKITALVKGRFQEASVAGCMSVQSSEFIEIVLSNRIVSVTAEHPVAVDNGVFRLAGYLKAGDKVIAWDEGAKSEPVISVNRKLKSNNAYNLMVSPGGTYVAGNIVVHNKGCFLPETPILRPDGSVTLISVLKRGDRVRAFTSDGKLVSAEIRNITKRTVGEYFVVSTGKVRLNVTGEHPFYVGAGTFMTLESLRVGGKIFAYDGKGISEQPITGIEKIVESTTVYNLQTDEPNTFFAGGVAVHNKGCFPRGTMILTAAGLRPIETLAKGDRVISVQQDGRTVETVVENIFVTEAKPRLIHTDYGVIRPTDEHPMAIPDGTFVPARLLLPGQHVWVFEEGVRVKATVIRNESKEGNDVVYNLLVGAPHTFIADGIIVHNKGGCFLPETPVLRADRTSVPINRIKHGDRVMAFRQDGTVTEAGVEKVMVQMEDEYFVITTEDSVLKVTGEHPFFVGNGW